MQDNNKDIKDLSLLSRVILLNMSLIIIIFDQITKILVRKYFILYQVKPVDSFCNWLLVYNKGVAFSFLANMDSKWQIYFFSLIAVLVALILVYYLLNKSYNLLTGISLSFVLGGAIGNLIDRLLFGKVTDFIDMYYKHYHWPTFNIADFFITVGMLLLIASSIFFGHKDKLNK